MSWFELWYMLKCICLITAVAFVGARVVIGLFRHDDDEDGTT